MNIKSLIIVAVLAMSSTSFAEIPLLNGQTKAPCPKQVAMIKQGLKSLLGYMSPAQSSFNARTLASYSSGSRSKSQSAKAPAAAVGAPASSVGNQ